MVENSPQAQEVLGSIPDHVMPRLSNLDQKMRWFQAGISGQVIHISLVTWFLIDLY